MNVRELKELLKDVPDEAIVMGRGYNDSRKTCDMIEVGTRKTTTWENDWRGPSKTIINECFIREGDEWKLEEYDYDEGEEMAVVIRSRRG